MSKHHSQRPDQAMRARSAQLRREQTPCEQILWQHLRGGKFGVKVRRQHPVGRFIADFCCIERQLIIEVDGPIHQQQGERDAERTLILETMGYRVLRFTNQQVLYETAAVLVQIGAALTPPAPSPVPGEGEISPQAHPHSAVRANLDHPPSPARHLLQTNTSIPPLPQAGEGDRG